MTENDDPLPAYLQHLQARIRARGRAAAGGGVHESLARLCSREPEACFDLIVRALDEALGAEFVVAIGNGLLEDLLNENAAQLADRVSLELRRNERFRQAFSFGRHASVDTAIIEGWVSVFRNLGTTRAKERKRTFRRSG